ncbi:MAG TPA: lysophospholipid acyltransferase family protein [Anaeromyxobacter sp.]
MTASLATAARPAPPVRPGTAPLTAPPPSGGTPVRFLRAGARVAELSSAVVSTLLQVRKVRREPSEEVRLRARMQLFREGARRVLRIHGVEVDAGGAEVPVQAVLVSNHVSWLDPFVVAAHVPCVPVSKADVLSWPVLGPLARDLGVVFVSRGDAGSGASALRSVRAALDAGACVLNFPEGTTSEGEDVLPFRPGMFGLALRSGAPIVPVALRYAPRSLAWTGDATFVPHYLSLAASRGARVSLRVGEPLAATANRSPREVAAEARERVAALLRDI